MPARTSPFMLPLLKELTERTGLPPIPVGVTGPYIRLTRAALEATLGPGAELTVDRELTQPGLFAANQRLTVRGPKACLEHVRVVGPLVASLQISLPVSAATRIGLDPPIRANGDLDESEGCELIGPAGAFTNDEGVIVPWRTLYASPKEAARYQLSDGQRIAIYLAGQRPCALDNVLVHVCPNSRLEFQIDLDEARATGYRAGDCAWLLPPWAADQRLGPAGEVPEGLRFVGEREVLNAHLAGRQLWIDAATIVTPSARDLDARLKVLKQKAPVA